MMVSSDEMALKALLAVIGRPGWEQDAPRMMIGVAMRQSHGHWDTTPSNAWGTIVTRRFARAYPGEPVGVTTARLGDTSISRNWPNPEPIRLPLPGAPAPLILSHATGRPFAYVSVKAAVPLTAADFAGYRISREIVFLQRRRPDEISRGDVIRVRVTVDAPVDRTWVVVDDPIPAGATILSRGGGSLANLGDGRSGDLAWPSWVERGLDSWRGYFDWLPRGRSTTEYVVRLNAAGRFQLPPTRVQAMYSPEIHAALPRPVMTIAE
jgi:hypothetical protein